MLFIITASPMLRVQLQRNISMAALGSILIGLQLLDGALTYAGIAQFGLTIEGNPIVAWSIEQFGVLTGLIATKVFAIALVLFIVRVATSIRWVSSALTGVAGVYIFAAIIPWLVLLNLNSIL